MPRSHLAAVSPESAYRVPWAFERDKPLRLRNIGAEALRGVTFALYGPGICPSSVPATLWPGDELEIVVAGDDLARSTLGIVRWLRPNGDEYLWRVSF